MSMKLCVNCAFFGKEVQEVGPRQMGMVAVCNHPDFVNPVDGSKLMPGFVRKEKDLCGLTGKGWIKNEAPPEPETPPEKPRILTSV